MCLALRKNTRNAGSTIHVTQFVKTRNIQAWLQRGVAFEKQLAFIFETSHAKSKRRAPFDQKAVCMNMRMHIYKYIYVYLCMTPSETTPSSKNRMESLHASLSHLQPSPSHLNLYETTVSHGFKWIPHGRQGFKYSSNKHIRLSASVRRSR